MKKIYILRHGEWDRDQKTLTAKTILKAKALKVKLPVFDIVRTSDIIRTQLTAKLLTNTKFEIDSRAGVLKVNEEQKDILKSRRKTHPFGIVGAIFSIPELIEPLKTAGKNLVDLTNEMFGLLPNESIGLIVSHNGTMVAAEKILKNESFAEAKNTYGNLEGYIIEESGRLISFR